MTNTYEEDASIEEKMLEEVRCTRCVLERILRVMDEGLFTDYQMEKFGEAYKTREPEPVKCHCGHMVMEHPLSVSGSYPCKVEGCKCKVFEERGEK